MTSPETSNDTNSKLKKTRSKKVSTLIDMTPMVDLGFLLISFFMLTTSLAKPVAMNLSMPIRDEHPIDIEQSKVLNIICDKNNNVWYYEGNEVTHLKKSNYTFDGIRKAILNKQKLVDAQWKKDENGFTKTICLIKMTDEASYNNMVDVLDEMDITDTKIYAIQDVNKLEAEAIANDGNVNPM
jgi:biopolymer transport protein ExbD